MKVPIDLAGVARFILSDQCRSVVILTGAGVSCASGIPDFRSPGKCKN
jgi:NAD-dependent SIR2 family protein deacetylase